MFGHATPRELIAEMQEESERRDAVSKLRHEEFKRRDRERQEEIERLGEESERTRNAAEWQPDSRSPTSAVADTSCW
jgi:hypothetical protein